MEDRRRKATRKINPKEKANFLSKLFFWTELCTIGNDLTENAPLRKHESKRLGDRLEAAWLGEENFRKKPSLARALTSVFGTEFALYGIVYFPLQIGIALLQVLFLSGLLDYYEPKQTSITSEKAYMYGAGLTLLSFLEVLTNNSFNFGLSNLGMKIRIACNSVIYRRYLKLKKSTLGKVKPGQMINLLSNDVRRFDNAFIELHFIWIGPLDIILASYYLVTTTGYSSLAGIILLVMSLLGQLTMSSAIASRRRHVALKTDHRMCLMNDIIANIETIKVNCWESVFDRFIKNARRLEAEDIKKANCLRIANGTFKFFLVEMCLYFCILAAILKGLPLTSEYVFVLKNIYDTLKNPVVTHLPNAVTHFGEVNMTIKRVQEFLTLDYEKATPVDNCILKSLQNFKNETPGITAEDITVNTTLKNINFEVLPGELAGITGGPASGKSLLFQILLKEMGTESGNLDVRGTISYASQKPWIFPSSIKQNILFGQKLDPSKYEKILKMCALEHDLSLLPHGDDTLVGERGVMLSAGQKARIHIARAVYQEADIYLLDDLLVNVESNMAKEIFQECIVNHLRDKCVLVITNQITLLEKIEKIYHLKKGKLVKIKTKKLERFLLQNGKIKLARAPDTSALLSQENRVKNSCTKTLRDYFDFERSTLTISKVIFMLIAIHALSALIDYFVSFWISLEDEPEKSGTGLKNLLATQNGLVVYTTLLLLLVVTTVASTCVFLQFSAEASRKLHDGMFAKVLRATMTFYDNNPRGGILNRFSRDLGKIDEDTPVIFKSVVELLCSLCATGILISVLNYYMILPTIVFLSICIYYNQMFSDKNLAKIEAVCQSPVYTHLMATMQGMTTIKSNSKVEKILREEFDEHQDVHTSAFYLSSSISYAFNFWSELTRVLYTGIVIFSFFLLKSKVGNVGLAITQAMQSELVQDFVKAWNDLDSNLISVERVMEYTQIRAEPESEPLAPKSWPKFGAIAFRSVSMQYFPKGPAILKDVSFEIRAGEKVGIVGRSASGKSSLISALLRLFHFQGTVLVDDVSTEALPLRVVRSSILVVPQEPVFLFGTLRNNLDPLHEFEDFQLWLALEGVGLKEYVSGLPMGLETEMSEDGYPISAKQRRLICLARGVLKNVKILVVFDKYEQRGDKLFRRVLKQGFKKCTVLVVTHVMQSVRNFDKVVILDEGCVKNFGKKILRRFPKKSWSRCTPDQDENVPVVNRTLGW